MAVNKIYTLTDPITNEVRYVGKSQNPKKRLYEHIGESKRKCNTEKHFWINYLLSKGYKPVIDVVEECDNSEAEFFEIFYISLFKSWGFNLTNKTIGGLSECMRNNKYSIGSTHKRKKISAIINNEYREFDSVSHASIELGIARRAISNTLNGWSKTTYGIKFSVV